jgi:hypothetical protein
MSDPEQQHVAITIPENVRPGEYSDVVIVWHNQFGFTLDFLTQVSPEPVPVGEGGEQALPMQVVSRVRIPPAVIFPLLQALNENLTTYEARFGRIEPQAHTEEGGQP